MAPLPGKSRAEMAMSDGADDPEEDEAEAPSAGPDVPPDLDPDRNGSGPTAGAQDNELGRMDQTPPADDPTGGDGPAPAGAADVTAAATGQDGDAGPDAGTDADGQGQGSEDQGDAGGQPSTCPECGADNPADATQCAECNAPLDDEQSEPSGPEGAEGSEGEQAAGAEGRHNPKGATDRMEKAQDSQKAGGEQVLPVELSDVFEAIGDLMVKALQPVHEELARVRSENETLRKGVIAVSQQCEEIKDADAAITKALTDMGDLGTLVKGLQESKDTLAQQTAATKADTTARAQTGAAVPPEVLKKSLDPETGKGGQTGEVAALVEKATKIRDEQGVLVKGFNADLLMDLGRGVVRPESIEALKAGIAEAEQPAA